MNNLHFFNNECNSTSTNEVEMTTFKSGYPNHLRLNRMMMAAITIILVTGLVTAVGAQSITAEESDEGSWLDKPGFTFTPANVTGFGYMLKIEEMEEDDQAVGGTTVGMQGGRYGVGFASSWPAYGLSGTLQFSETFTGEVILGFLGVVSNIGARAWYRFNTNHNYDIYAYGGLSLLMYRYDTFDSSFNRTKKTETVPGIGAGVGMEFSLQQLLDDDTFPPLFFTLELGLSIASFNNYDFSFLSFGSGIRYRFGDH